MRFRALCHVPFEDPATIQTWAEKNGHSFEITPLWRKSELPSLNDFDFLVVMGGPMNIYEEKEYPWLREEKNLLEKAISGGKRILGICLGAQLIADVLGGKVYKNPQKEIGWMPVEWTSETKRSDLFADFSGSLDVLHWHGDTFHLPSGAIHLARSQACENQAFVYDERIVGLQFHIEATPRLVRQFVQNGKEELIKAPFVQTGDEILSNQSHYSEIKQALDHLLSQMVKRENSVRAPQV
jgi:GMP synthase-like glutamine amidotransferase